MHTDRAADTALIEAARAGDAGAFGELWKRHSRAALHAARSIAPSLDADDLVAEAFAKILAQLDQGNGPTSSFRSYLYQVIRNSAMDVFRANGREESDHDLDALEGEVAVSDDPERRFDLAAVRNAFASLPERQQEVLWYTEVEGLPPRKAAPILGVSASAVAALSMRARKRLRAAWIAEHAQNSELPKTCTDTIRLLSAYHAGRISSEDRAAVESHIESCSLCSSLMSESARVYSRPGQILAAAVLGSGMAGSLSFSLGAPAPVFAASALGTLGSKAAVGALAVMAAAALIGGSILAVQGRHGEPAAPPTAADEGGGGASSPAQPPAAGDSGMDAPGDEGDAEGSPTGPEPRPQEPEHTGTDPEPEPSPATDPRPPVLPPEPERPVTPSAPVPPEAPEEPAPPSISDELPHTLPALEFSRRTVSNWRLWVQGTSAEAGAAVRLRVTSQPVEGGPRYGSVRETRAWANGYWAFGNVGGISPLNVTVEVQQFTDTAASPWTTVVSGETFEPSSAGRSPGDFNGVMGWYLHGWPEAHWALREIGASWPRASGSFSTGGGAVIPMPGDVPEGELREFEIGYWVQGRFDPIGELVAIGE